MANTQDTTKRPFITKAKATVEARCRCGNKVKMKAKNDEATVMQCPNCGWHLIIKAVYGIWNFVPKEQTGDARGESRMDGNGNTENTENASEKTKGHSV